jgi:hypothetical protein
MPASSSLSGSGLLKVFPSVSSATLVNTLLDFICSLVPIRTKVCEFPFNRSARLKSLGTDVAVFMDAAAEHVGGDSWTAHDVCSWSWLSWNG